jgi:hypothetical protein
VQKSLEQTFLLLGAERAGLQFKTSQGKVIVRLHLKTKNLKTKGLGEWLNYIILA